jgi:hypothetical protein
MQAAVSDRALFTTGFTFVSVISSAGYGSNKYRNDSGSLPTSSHVAQSLRKNHRHSIVELADRFISLAS